MTSKPQQPSGDAKQPTKESHVSVADNLSIRRIESSEMPTKACHDQCPLKLKKKGDLSQTMIREGDTIRIKSIEKTFKVKTVMVDYGPKMAEMRLHGKRVPVAAARLVLESHQVVYVTQDIERICPDCGQCVQDYRHGPDVQDG